MKASILRNSFAAILATLLTAAVFTGCGQKESDLDKGLAAYNQKDFKTAVGHFASAAEQDDAEAQYRLAMCYAEGKGVEQNNAKSFEWTLKSAKLGNAKAQCVVGMCYIGGNEVQKDEAEGKKWIEKSIPGLRVAAEQGDADAQAYLGACYGDGVGVGQDADLSRKWIRAAAEQGHSTSLLSLGMMSLQDQNVIEAVEWFRKAAEAESVEAQFLMGRIYENGILDIRADKAEAEKWYRIAAAGSDPDVAKEAKNALNRLEEKK